LYTGNTSNITKEHVDQLILLSKELGIENIVVSGVKDDIDVDEPNPAAFILEETFNTIKEISVLKLETCISDFQSNETMKLSFPKSRVNRKVIKLQHAEILSGFERKVQVDYNDDPVGQYMGPYDQNEQLKLSVQLPRSKLDFEKYTKFQHDEPESCKILKIADSYAEIDDLNKINALQISDRDISEIADMRHEYEKDDNIFYSCANNGCFIPCPCLPCCTDDGQCVEHRVKHVELFDMEKDLISIRSTETFCIDKNFFQHSYILKYPGIPRSCCKCKKDLLHHNSYHLVFHDNCKFCRQNRFKLFAKTAKELRNVQKKEDYYIRSVCPHCNKKFCDPSTRKKHIELEHMKTSYKCDICDKTFHAKQSKEYHIIHHHTAAKQSEKCGICHATFTSTVSLRNHVK
jgi:hypothetical protein